MAYNNLLLSSSTIHILLIIFPLLLPIVFSIIQDVELRPLCDHSTKTLTPNYTQSRMYVLDALTSNAPLNKGFYQTTQAEDDDDPSYGLALCRGDVSMYDCGTCLTNAAMAISNSYCPYSLGATILRDFCQLRYSDVDFRGIIDTDRPFLMDSGGNDVDFGFTIAVRTLVKNLQDNASQSTMLFARGSVPNAIGNNTLYGMVQCTRDLSGDGCRTCVDLARDNLSDTKVGARVVFESCSVRFEIYPFLFGDM